MAEIGHYLIKEQLGKGGMGSVYRAIDRRLQRTVAIKVMRPQLAQDIAFRKRFLREARAAAALNHPSVINIYEFNEINHKLVLVSEYIPTGALETYLTPERVDLEEALVLVAQIADALDHAHQHKVVHRDIKPANVLLRQTPSDAFPLRAVVTDWGLAEKIEPTQTAPDFVGTLAYMAPEAVFSETLDGRADLFALGVILYQLLTGALPHQGSAESTAMPPHLPERVSTIISQALQRQPADRYQHAASMSQALRAVATTLTTDELAQYGTGKSLVQEVATMSKRKPKKPDQTILASPEEMEDVVEEKPQFKDVAQPQTRPEEQPPPPKQRRRRQKRSAASGGRRINQRDAHSANRTLVDEQPQRPQRSRNEEAQLYNPRQRKKPSSTPQERVLVQLFPSQIRLDPGEAEQIEIKLKNLGPVDGDYSVKVKNSSDAIRMELLQKTVRLAPGGNGSLMLTVHAPKHNSLHAGQHEFRVIAGSNQSRRKVGETDGLVTVTPFEQFSFDMQPKRLKQNKTLQVVIKNEGNASVRYRVSGKDRSALIDYDVLEPVVEIAPGEEQNVPVKLSVFERSWFGKDERVPFEMRVQTTAGEHKTRTGTLTVRPYIPRIYAAIGGVLLFCLILFGLYSIFSSDLPVPTDFDQVRQYQQLCNKTWWLPRAVKQYVIKPCNAVRKYDQIGRTVGVDQLLEGAAEGSATDTTGVFTTDGTTTDPPDNTTDPEAATTTGEDEIVLEGAGTRPETTEDETDPDDPSVAATATPRPEVDETILSGVAPEIPIGETVRGSAISNLVLGDDTNDKAILVIGGIHSGFAPSTVQMADALAAHFSANPGLIPENITLYVISNLNPDAPMAIRERSGRFNSNGVDLNRNFDCNWTRDPMIMREQVVGAGGTGALSEREAQHLESWIDEVQPSAVIVFGAGSSEVTAGGCNGATQASTNLATAYASSAGLRVGDGSGLTGDVTDWLATSKGIPAIFVLLSDHQNASAELSQHVAAITEVLNIYR